MKHKKIQTFEQHSSELNISDVIKRLETDDSEIKIGDYFLEVGEYNFIHILKDFSDGDEGYDDYKLPNGTGFTRRIDDIEAVLFYTDNEGNMITFDTTKR